MVKPKKWRRQLLTSPELDEESFAKRMRTTDDAAKARNAAAKGAPEKAPNKFEKSGGSGHRL